MSRKDNKINMPSSGAGLTRYFDAAYSKIMITPQTTIIMIIMLVVIVLILSNL
ncbi:preprotein translocase subunit Sec61beta [Candidatus Woesearchaeota archaeon]|nr:preprotein translocase subunit Sec61beta [Candidatus Woesearchaeota archaeon]